jgi:protoporphyrinogen oxidase
MMWERFRERIAARGGRVLANAHVERLECEGKRIRSAVVRCGGKRWEVGGEHFVSSIPLPGLVDLLPGVPAEVGRAVAGLSFRAFVLVGLIVGREDLFPDNWIYVHSPEFRVGRIQNFKNWSAEMVPDPRKTSLGMEYFCSEGDDLWSMEDGELIELAGRELEELGLAKRAEVEDGVVIRQSHAYPVYDQDYQEHLRIVRGFLEGWMNLQSIGRNGMHRYNNQDHAMLTGLLAARNLLGGRYDLWEVNVERSYAEEMRTERRHAPDSP